MKATEEAARRKAAEEAQQRTLEQMRKMASKYSNDDATATIRVIDDSPLLQVLLAAYEDSFNQEDREIKRGGATTNPRAGKKGGRRGQEEQSFVNHNKRGLKSPSEQAWF